MVMLNEHTIRNVVGQNKSDLLLYRLFCMTNEHYNYLQLKQSFIKMKLFMKDY